MVQCPLARNAKVSVDVSDYSLARDGDTVELNGWYYLGRKNRVFARTVSISSSHKLSMEVDSKKKSKKKSKADDKEEKTDVEKKLEDLFSD